MNVKNKIILYISMLLIVSYPLDQLLGGIIKYTAFISPVKIIMSLYVAYAYVNRKYYDSIEVQPVLTAMICLIGLSYASSLWAIKDVVAGLLYSTQMLILFCFTYSTIILMRRESNIINNIMFYSGIVGAITSVLIMNGVFSAAILVATKRIALIGIGINSVSVTIGTCFIMCITYIMQKRGNKKQILLMMLCMMPMILILLRMGTRSVLWGIVMSTIIALLISYKIKNVKYVAVYVIISVVVIISLQYVVESGFIKGKLLDRIIQIEAKTFEDNSRLDLWDVGIEWYSNNVIGTGAGNEKYAFVEMAALNMEAHNTFLSTLIQYGIPGVIILLFIMLYMYKNIKSFKNVNDKYLYLSILLFMTLQMIKQTTLQTRLFWQPIAFLLILLETNNIQESGRK